MSRASILRTPIITLGGDRMKIFENIYDLTPEIYKVLSSTSYRAKTMKEGSHILNINIIINDLGYTGVGQKIQNEKQISQWNFLKRLKISRTKHSMKLI